MNQLYDVLMINIVFELYNEERFNFDIDYKQFYYFIEWHCRIHLNPKICLIALINLIFKDLRNFNYHFGFNLHL